MPRNQAVRMKPRWKPCAVNRIHQPPVSESPVWWGWSPYEGGWTQTHVWIPLKQTDTTENITFPKLRWWTIKVNQFPPVLIQKCFELIYFTCLWPSSRVISSDCLSLSPNNWMFTVQSVPVNSQIQDVNDHSVLVWCLNAWMPYCYLCCHFISARLVWENVSTSYIYIWEKKLIVNDLFARDHRNS